MSVQGLVEEFRAPRYYSKIRGPFTPSLVLAQALARLIVHAILFADYFFEEESVELGTLWKQKPNGNRRIFSSFSPFYDNQGAFLVPLGPGPL